MFGKKGVQVIKFEQNLCHANIDDNDVLFVRVSDIVTDKNAIVEVPFTHDAIIIKGGGDCRYYKSGSYDVFDNKTEVKNWKKGLSVDVVYIPKDTRVLIKWGTPNRLRYRDEASGRVITVGAFGEFDVSVCNAEQFFRKVVGVKKEFDLDEFGKRYSETVATEFADIFLRVVAEMHLTYDKFTANKKSIGVRMGEILSPMFESQWGLSVLNFKIADFSLTDSDMNAIESAAAEATRQERLGSYLRELERLDDKQWEREKYLRELQLKDNAAYYEVLKIAGKHKETRKCPHCGTEVSDSATFCSVCGKRIANTPIACPHCGRINDCSAAFCSGCGKKLI